MANSLAHSRLPCWSAKTGGPHSDLTAFLDRVGGPLFRSATAEAKLDMAWGLLRLSDAELAAKGLSRAGIFEHIYEGQSTNTNHT